MMKLKMMLMKVLFGIGVIQLLLVAGGAFLFYYLKHNTHCKIQGHPIHTHSHVLEPEEHGSYFCINIIEFTIILNNSLFRVVFELPWISF